MTEPFADIMGGSIAEAMRAGKIATFSPSADPFGVARVGDPAPASCNCTGDFTDTAECMATCGPDPSGNQLKWEATNPQFVLSTAQGFVGQRLASFKGSLTQLYAALATIYDSHWPGQYQWCCDAVPVEIRVGPSFAKVNIFGNIADTEISDKLESFNEYAIGVTYQLLRMTDPWPPFGKPPHPIGTVLTLQVRGGGEILQVDPTSMHSSDGGAPLASCYYPGKLQYAPNQTFNSRIRIPLTEYHLNCDRLTDDQLCGIFGHKPWKCREGTVNADTPEGNAPLFMNESEGTLLFDTWTLDPTFAPDITNPRRWRLGCVLKCRQMPLMNAPYPEDCSDAGAKYAIGWNHDFVRHASNNKLSWAFIMMAVAGSWEEEAAWTPHGYCPTGFVPRYPYLFFQSMFCDVLNHPENCCPDQTPTSACNADCNANVGAARQTADMESSIAQIVHDGRHVAGRKFSRDLAAIERGEIEVWPEGSKTP